MAIQFVDKKNAGTPAVPVEIVDSTAHRAILRNSPGAAGFCYDVASDTLKYNGADAVRTVQSNVAQVSNQPTAAFELTAEQSGTEVFIGTTAGFDITLPLPAAGLHYRFTVAAAFASSNYVVKTNGAAAIIFGAVDVAGSVVAADAEKQINFVATAELPGDWAEVWSDGTNWYVRGYGVTAGSITVTAP